MNTCETCGAQWNPSSPGNGEDCPNCIATGRLTPEKPSKPVKLKPWTGRGATW